MTFFRRRDAPLLVIKKFNKNQIIFCQALFQKRREVGGKSLTLEDRISCVWMGVRDASSVLRTHLQTREITAGRTRGDWRIGDYPSDFCFEPLRHCAINVRIHTSDIVICVLHRRHRATPGNTVTQHTNVERRCSAKKKKSRRQAGELIFSFYVHCCSYAKLPHCVAFLNVSLLLRMPGPMLFFAEHLLFMLFCHGLAPCCPVTST